MRSRSYLAEKFQERATTGCRGAGSTLEGYVSPVQVPAQELDAAVKAKKPSIVLCRRSAHFMICRARPGRRCCDAATISIPGTDVQPGCCSPCWRPPSPSRGLRLRKMRRAAARAGFRGMAAATGSSLDGSGARQSSLAPPLRPGHRCHAGHFGHMGAPATHPELLDWLATEFVARGWRRQGRAPALILMSSTYRQESTLDPKRSYDGQQVDPENQLLWTQRNAAAGGGDLARCLSGVAGTLNPQMFGPPVPMQRQADGEVTAGTQLAGHRRSVYLQVRRSQPLTLLQVFDQPVMETNCTRRVTSTVSAQGADLAQQRLCLRQADALAARVLKRIRRTGERFDGDCFQPDRDGERKTQAGGIRGDANSPLRRRAHSTGVGPAAALADCVICC